VAAPLSSRLDGVTLEADGNQYRVKPGGIGTTELAPAAVGAAATRAILASDVAVTTSPATVFTVSIPAAGTYAIEGTLVVRAGNGNGTNLGGTQIVSFTFAHADASGCQIGWAQGASISTANGFGYATSLGAALPAIVYASTQINVFASSRCWGEVTFSAAGTLTISVVITGSTADCKAGSVFQVVRTA
jgi:hypothetical protein